MPLAQRADIITPVCWPGLLSPTECAIWREEYSTGTMGFADTEDDYEPVRQSRVVLVDTEKASPPLKSILSKIFDACRAIFAIDISGIDPTLNLLTYDEGDFFHWHIDAGTGEYRERKLTVCIQLSRADEYEGGDLEFFPSYRPRDGRALGTVTAFTPFVWHRVTPLHRGKRMAAVLWLTGPAFR